MKQAKKSLNHDSPDLLDSYDSNNQANQKNHKNQGSDNRQGDALSLPKGWEIKSLGEIADVEYGFTDKSTEEGDYRYVRITDIDDNGEWTATPDTTPVSMNFWGFTPGYFAFPKRRIDIWNGSQVCERATIR